jgi:hypothetical protein
MFKKRYGFGESEYEHFPDGFKLPKMPSARKLLKEIEEREKAKSENTDEPTEKKEEPEKK